MSDSTNEGQQLQNKSNNPESMTAQVQTPASDGLICEPFRHPPVESPWNRYLPMHFTHTTVTPIVDDSDLIYIKFNEILPSLDHFFDGFPEIGASIEHRGVNIRDYTEHYDDVKTPKVFAASIDQDDYHRWGGIQPGLIMILRHSFGEREMPPLRFYLAEECCGF